jgi:predicted transposase/invertase (TIGR01784 family)
LLWFRHPQHFLLLKLKILGEQLLERLSKLMQTIQQLPEDSQQKFVAWMANLFLQKLPEDESHIQEFFQNMKGEVSMMGLEKVLDDIKREGRREGKKEGRREGKREGKEEVAKRMIDLGLDVSVIVAATGFSPEKIDQLRKKSQ